MPDAPLNPTTRYGQIRVGEMDRLAASAVKSSRVTTDGGLGKTESAAGFNLIDLRLQKIFIRISAPGVGSGSGSGSGGGSAVARYSWNQVYGVNQTTWGDLVPPDGMGGSADGVPAVEVNGNTAVPVGTVVEATIDPVNVCVRFNYGGAGSGSTVTVLITEIAVVQGTQTTPSGCGTGCEGSKCPEWYHEAVIQTLDPACGTWSNGACVFVVEENQRRLEIGRRYDARLIGTRPIMVQGLLPVFPSSSCGCTASTDLYMVDAGDITRVIQVTAHVGGICQSGGSGSGSGSNLDVWRGMAVRWNTATCKWDLIEDDVLIAHVAGCPLAVGSRYLATWEENISAANLGGSGSGSGHCTPFYLTQVRVGSYVTDVLCVGGVTKVYKSVDECGTSAYSHDAGCCTCGSPGSGGGGSGAACPCSGKPTATHFHVGTFALTNGTCTNCPSFPASFDITNSAACQWDSSTLFNPCGGSCGATLSYDSVTNSFILNIAAGTIFTANYTIPAASFACNGSNVLTFVSSNGACANWPATVTITPF